MLFFPLYFKLSSEIQKTTQKSVTTARSEDNDHRTQKDRHPVYHAGTSLAFPVAGAPEHRNAPTPTAGWLNELSLKVSWSQN